MKIARIILPLLLLAAPLRAHEVWIEPDSFALHKGKGITASLKNGQNFAGIELGWFDGTIAQFDLVTGGKSTPIRGRAGDIPAIQNLSAPPGLAILAFRSKHSTVTYDTWDVFQAFIDHKDLGDIRAAHAARGLPDAPLKEVYTRHAKALIGIGHAKGVDQPLGLEIELIALANPYRDDLSAGLPVLLLYQGAPRVNAQIELFDRAPDGTVTVTLHRTDTAGKATLPVTPGHSYLVDAVLLRAPAPDIAERYRAQWQSLWAALTFAVPD